MQEQSKLRIFYPIDGLAIWVVCASLLGIIGLSTETFYPNAILIISTLCVGAMYVYFRGQFQWLDKRFNKNILIIMAFALLFRLNPFLYYSAGQDQGIYVLMSHSFETSHGVSFIDNFRETLGPEEQKLYDKFNSGKTNVSEVKGKRSAYQFDVYPLSSVWLSYFGKILRSEFRAYSLVFFGLLSILLVYLITYELTASVLAACLAAALLAFCPYHIFFSKFPTSEITTVGLSSFAFYYAVRLWRSADEEPRAFYAVLSCLLFLCFIFARITGVLYLPLWFLICFFSIRSQKNPKLKLTWLMVFVGVIAALFSSGYFYYLFYPRLFPTYDDMVFNRLGPFPYLTTAVLIGIAIALCWFADKFFRKQSASVLGTWALRCIMILVSIYSCYMLYRLGWDNLIESSKNHHYRMYLHSSSWRMLTYWPFITLVCMISPFALFALVRQLWMKEAFKDCPPLLLVYFHLLMFFGLIVWHNGFDFYAFYYTRYHITEVLPAAAIIVGFSLAILLEHRHRFFSLGRVLTAATIGWCAFFSSFQIGTHEGPRVGFYQEFTSRVDRDDLVIFYDIPTRKEITAPIRFFYDYEKTLNLDFPEIPDNEVLRGFARYGKRVFVLSARDDLEADPRFTGRRRLIFEYDFMSNKVRHLYSGAFKGADLMSESYGLKKFPIPTNQLKKRLNLFLYTANLEAKTPAVDRKKG